jgi:antibiotic biosynthesis monooxygenase (ABM) superfamily enzyme
VSGRIVYEVNLEVDAAIEAEYRAWLERHVAEILALPGFLGADVEQRLDPAPPAGRFALCVRYRLCDQAALDHYLQVHAPSLRQQGLERFPGRFSAFRRVLQDSRA